MTTPAWDTLWRESFNISPQVPQWLLASMVLALVYIFVILPCTAVFTYVDRKLGADFQARVGPNRAGPAGILQPLADLLKMIQKEDRAPRHWRETLWFSVHTMALYSTVAVLPLGSMVVLVDADMSAFLPFWAALVLSLGTMLLGLSQRTVPGWLGGTRVAAQALAGAVPAVFTLLSAGLPSGGFRWTAIVAAQGAWPSSWTAFSNPFQFVAFLVYVIAGLVLLGVPPLDGGLSLSDIHGGVSSHLSGRRLSLFRFGRFYGFFLWSVIGSVLFLGAWNLPAGLQDSLSQSRFAEELLEVSLLIFKTAVLMLTVIWTSRVNPRSRVDQITDFSWRVLSPFSLFALIGAALWAGWRGFFS
jgi:NADH-quinone oxidoreductase subunit H